MNYRELFRGQCLFGLGIIAENWYARLNRLKAWLIDNPDHWKRYKAADLAAEMAVRMMVVGQIYARAVSEVSKIPGANYSPGGMPFVKETGPEVIFVSKPDTHS